MPITKLPMDLSKRAVRELLNRAQLNEGIDDLILDPDYQRDDVWTLDQRVNLIRSLLLGIPLGAIYLNYRADQARSAVVDGKQRITTLRMWFDGEFGVPTDWFEDQMLGAPRETLGDTVTINELAAVASRAFATEWAIAVGELSVPADQEPGVYLLVNFGGVAQTDEDRARVEALI